MDIVFADGGYQSPTVITIPGLVSTSSPALSRVFWGEDIVFNFPDPGAGDFALIIKAALDDTEPLIADDATHVGGSALVFTITGPDARKLLDPGLFYFGLLKTDDGSYTEIASGIFTLVEGASSSEVPAST